jgi:hypothetical protein
MLWCSLKDIGTYLRGDKYIELPRRDVTLRLHTDFRVELPATTGT